MFKPTLKKSLLLACLLSGAAGAAPMATAPLNQTVQANAYSQLDYFFKKLAADKSAIVIDGYAPFQSKDKFLPGKVAAGLGDLLLNTPKDDPRLPQMLRDYRDLADMTVGMDNDTWGIYYYMQTLVKLKNAGLLEQAVSPATLEQLRKRLDWKTFVTQPGYELIRLPTNYYGVAFSIARLRMLMGWEDESGSKVLLDRMLKHYAAYSGAYGFSDETDGEGRFDRYSILLIAEICERFIETGLPVTSDLKALLHKAAVVALNAATATGEGFSFGRSLGPYGETAMLEILSTAAYLDVLTPDEKEYAYSYSAHIAARYMNFWYDPALHSLDMWGKGRRTDTYRGKHRILGENFSLLHQLIATNEMWNKAGMRDRQPKAGLQAWLDRSQPAFSMTRFASGEYDRALAIFRDKSHVFSLLMINGGQSQHANSPYYPLPFAPGIVSGIADSGYQHPQLLPKFVLADGSELIGTAWLKDIRHTQDGQQYRVTYRQDGLTRLGQGKPVKDTRIALDTAYTMQPGTITRTDTYTPAGPLQVTRLSLEFASFSDQATVDGNKIRFKQGDVHEFEVSGVRDCKVEDTRGSDLYKAPYGPMKTLVSCAAGPFAMNAPLVVKWVLRYR